MTAQVQEAKTFDLAIAGELNLDVILYGLPLEMPTERDLIATNLVSTLGSSSAIVAHNAAALGLNVQFTTLVGDDDSGRTALSRLAEAGVDLSNVIIDKTQKTGVTILLPHGRERHSLTYLGAIAELTTDHLKFEKLQQARHLHVSSFYLQAGLRSGIVDLLRTLKSSGMSISLDTNDDPDNLWGEPLYEALPFVDVFLPNEDEICRMAGNVDLDQALNIMGAKVPTIVVKRGRNGCRVRHQGETTDIHGHIVTPVDTIGAGDSFDAGFLYAYLKGLDLMACATAGNITGALSTQGTGGTEAFRDKALREAFLRERGFPGR